jgi:hypothetical protein
MRFIRKGGRVIPIQDGRGDSKKPRAVKTSGGYGKQAATGVIAGAIGSTGTLAQTLGAKTGNMKAVKFGLGARTLSFGANVGSTVGAIKKGVDVSRETGSTTQGLKEFAKQKGSNLVGQATGTGIVAGAAGYKMVKGAHKRAAISRMKKLS